MDIACVLSRSPDFQDKHVQWLKRQCEQFVPHDDFIVGHSEAPVPGVTSIPLMEGYPKWWAKMELFKHLKGPALILDLDTVFIKPISFTKEQLGKDWVLRHPTRDGFRCPEELGCGVMLLTEGFRRKVHDHFVTDPHGFMAEVRDDDQKYYQKYWNKDLNRLQDEFPDVFASYKLNVLQHGFYEDNAVIYFHGKPRPWDLKETWIPPC